MAGLVGIEGALPNLTDIELDVEVTTTDPRIEDRAHVRGLARPLPDLLGIAQAERGRPHALRAKQLTAVISRRPCSRGPALTGSGRPARPKLLAPAPDPRDGAT